MPGRVSAVRVTGKRGGNVTSSLVCLTTPSNFKWTRGGRGLSRGGGESDPWCGGVGALAS